MNLTKQQKVAVRSGEAVRVQDDDLECVVVRADVYDRVRELLYADTDWTDDELRRALAKSAEANGWNAGDEGSGGSKFNFAAHHA